MKEKLNFRVLQSFLKGTIDMKEILEELGTDFRPARHCKSSRETSYICDIPGSIDSRQMQAR